MFFDLTIAAKTVWQNLINKFKPTGPDAAANSDDHRQPSSEIARMANTAQVDDAPGSPGQAIESGQSKANPAKANKRKRRRKKQKRRRRQ